MKDYLLHFVFVFILFSGCTKTTTILNPQEVSLIEPLNDETCLDGISLNDSQSIVDFGWTRDPDSKSYELVITNLFSLKEQVYFAESNEISITLIKAEPYQWFVRSIGEEGSLPASSEKWKFYLAGDAIVNYAPFPAELIAPRSGSNITPDVNNQITLNWTASDVDGDLDRFELYLDDNDPPSLFTELTYTNEEVIFEIEVEKNKTYYWKVISIDINENQSESGIYAFRTN